MEDEDAVVPRLQRRWRWLLIVLLLVVGFVSLLLRVALAPLATSVLNGVLGDQSWKSKVFRVSGGGISHLTLEGVDFADGPWRFTADEVVLRFGLDVASTKRIKSIEVIGGHWTQDLDQRAGVDSEAMAAEPSVLPVDEIAATGLPVDMISATGLTLTLRRDGEEITLLGDVQLSDGWTSSAPLIASLNHSNAELRVVGSLKNGWELGAANAEGRIENLQDWLGWLGPGVLPEVFDTEGVVTEAVTVALDWREGTVQQWKASTTSFQGGIAQIPVRVKDLALEGVNQDGQWITSAQGVLEQVQWQAWHAVQGAWSWRNHLGKQTFSAKGLMMNHGTTVSAVLDLDGRLAEGQLQLDASWKGARGFGQGLVDGTARVSHQENEPWIVRCPVLATNDDQHPRAIEVLASIWPLASPDELFAKVHGALAVPEHSLPMSFSAGLTRKSSERWESDLSLNLSSDSPTSPRQFYWMGLAFTINGVVDGRWAFQADQQHPITMSASLGSVEMRRNESALALEEVSLTGSYPMATGKLSVQGRGKSGKETFTLAIDADLAPNESEQKQVHYHIKNFDVAENTLLGAFAEAMNEMPIAAKTHADGVLRFPKEGPVEHELTLQLREGRYRHPERRLQAKGLEGTFAIQSFSPFVTAEDQEARFTEWRAGPLTLSKGKFRYKLGPRGAVMIKEAEAKGLGGSLALDSLGYYPGHPEFESVLTFEHIELSELIALTPKFSGEVTGKVSGKVYLRLKDGILSLPKGRLTLDEGSAAHLRLNAKEMLGAQLTDFANDPGTLSIIEDAMKDLVIKDLKIGFFDPDKSEQVCRIRLEGHSRKEVTIPETNGGKAIAPIQLNINVDDPSEIVRQLLNLGLSKQFDANR